MHISPKKNTLGVNLTVSYFLFSYLLECSSAKVLQCFSFLQYQSCILRVSNNFWSFARSSRSTGTIFSSVMCTTENKFIYILLTETVLPVYASGFFWQFYFWRTSSWHVLCSSLMVMEDATKADDFLLLMYKSCTHRQEILTYTISMPYCPLCCVSQFFAAGWIWS